METTEKETVKEGEGMNVSSSTACDAKGMESKTSPMKGFRPAIRMSKKSVKMFVAAVVILGILYSVRGLLVAVTVNGSPISRWSVIRELEKKSGEQALDTMVTKKLIATAAKKAGIMVSTADIDKEIASVTDQITQQGGTLAMALEQQGMTETEFRDQIVLQKELERLLGDTLAVSDDDVNQYISQSKAVAPKGMNDEDFKNRVREQLKGQKFGMAASNWVTDAKAKAQLTYFVDYAPKKAPETAAPTNANAPSPASNEASSVQGK